MRIIRGKKPRTTKKTPSKLANQQSLKDKAFLYFIQINMEKLHENELQVVRIRKIRKFITKSALEIYTPL